MNVFYSVSSSMISMTFNYPLSKKALEESHDNKDFGLTFNSMMMDQKLLMATKRKMAYKRWVL